jgi:hypothetical protein
MTAEGYYTYRKTKLNSFVGYNKVQLMQLTHSTVKLTQGRDLTSGKKGNLNIIQITPFALFFIQEPDDGPCGSKQVVASNARHNILFSYKRCVRLPFNCSDVLNYYLHL